MTITYYWQDPDQTMLRYVDDSTTPDTVEYIPAEADNTDYVTYLSWVAEGNTAYDPVYPGFEDAASARTTRLAVAAIHLTSFIKDGEYTFNFFRALSDSTYTLPAGTQTKFNDAYSLYGTFETAINSETDIEKIRLSTIDYEAGTYNI